jgi:hypothetical protein
VPAGGVLVDLGIDNTLGSVCVIIRVDVPKNDFATKERKKRKNVFFEYFQICDHLLTRLPASQYKKRFQRLKDLVSRVFCG